MSRERDDCGEGVPVAIEKLLDCRIGRHVGFLSNLESFLIEESLCLTNLNGKKLGENEK